MYSSLLRIGKLFHIFRIHVPNHLCTYSFQIYKEKETSPYPILFLAPFLILIIDQIPDRSENLVRIAVTHQPHSTIIADNLNLPHPDAFFDFAISIAVIHHLSTQERRTQAIQEILRTLRPATESYPGGRALIYAWALEQKNSRRGWDKGDSQDVMVPWILKGGSAKDGFDEPPKTFHRYYHLYEESELERDINRAGGRVLESGYDRDNWWAIATRSNE